MPIRRAAATPTQEKAPSAAEKEPEASPEDSPSAKEEQAASSAAVADVEEGKATGETEPAENGEKADEKEEEEEAAEVDNGSKETEKKDDKCKDCAAGQCATHCYVLLLRLKDGYKYGKSKVKKVKRTIPVWASVTGSKKRPVANFAGTQYKVDNILVEAIASCKSGLSYQSVMKYILKKYPDMELDRKKFLIKKAMKKHLEKGTIKQLKGKGLSGTFAIGKQPSSSKKSVQKANNLGDALHLIITRLCEPKEASYTLIKKYLEQHFPSFNIEKRPKVLKNALVKAVEKGQLEQITGTGAKGTFQLKRSWNQVPPKSTMDDAITAAITAMNEPKTCSTTTLRRYIVDANKDVKEYHLVANLRRTLKKCKILGWMEQITGHGFKGTYQLSFPFYPSPDVLYPEKFKDLQNKNAHPPTKQKRTFESSDEEEEESSEEEEEEEESSSSEEDDEPPPPKRKSQKRPPPRARRPPPAKKSRSASQSKARGGRPPAKKSPAKKATASPAKRLGKKPAATKKESTPPSKATPVKRGAPARRPKTPAIKKLNKRAAKQPVSTESSAEEAVVTKETTRSKRSKPEESTPKETATKKPMTKSGSRHPEPEESSSEKPVVKRGAKRSKQSTRKSKRGKN
ncbi:heterochromatin protein 1-binding protein 3 isoform X1 [Solea senegalensis]|uniref:Heterochromatin protein 1-binding protein 3 isoform X1 n=1 Tax=Solea senegalensis TaxID=28829 RepID=A0AAV6QPF7_SOLSE|nr:heterochromatin protein 1-binding protein 3 isoform X1 [Solea senegalensis]KAG7493954.1 heterochromatin protein 1-binding protein 3 isoform X1 [Solea senegalensis]